MVRPQNFKIISVSVNEEVNKPLETTDIATSTPLTPQLKHAENATRPFPVDSLHGSDPIPLQPDSNDFLSDDLSSASTSASLGQINIPATSPTITSTSSRARSVWGRV